MLSQGVQRKETLGRPFFFRSSFIVLLAFTQPSFPSICLTICAFLFKIRFHLDRAIFINRYALQLQPPPSVRCDQLQLFIDILHMRYNIYRLQADLDERISSYRRADILLNFAMSLRDRFGKSPRPEDVEEAVSAYEDALNLNPELRSTPSLHILADIFNTRFNLSHNRDDVNYSISLHHAALTLRPIDDPGRYRSLYHLANADLEEAISLHREFGSLTNLANALATRVRASDQPALSVKVGPPSMWSTSLQNLATALETRNASYTSRENLDESIAIYREALNNPPTFHSVRVESLSRFLEDIDEIVSVQRSISTALRYQRHASLTLAGTLMTYQASLELRPGQHPDHARHKRFGYIRLCDDLEAMIPLCRELLALQPDMHIERPVALYKLANAPAPDSLAAFDEAIVLYYEAVEIQEPSADHALRRRFSISGESGDIDKALDLPLQFQQHCRPDGLTLLADQQDLADEIELPNLTESHRFGASNDLASRLLSRCAVKFEDLDDFDNMNELRINKLKLPLSQYDLLTSEQWEDIAAALGVMRAALKLSLPQNERSPMMSAFANMLQIQCDKAGQRTSITDLDELIAVYQELLQSAPDDVPTVDTDSSDMTENSQSLRLIDTGKPVGKSRIFLSTNLGNAFRKRFEISGRSTDIDSSIIFYEAAIKLTEAEPSSHRLNNLAKALHIRHRQSGHRNDLDRAVSLNRKALSIHPPNHPGRTESLVTLADVLYGQSRVLGSNQHEYLLEAISLYRAALEIKPVSSNDSRSHCIGSLANALALMSHLVINGDALLDEAIMLHREGLALRPELDSDRPTGVINLAAALSERFDRSGSREDLDASIDVFREILFVPKRHFDQPMIIANLAYALAKRSKAFHSRDDLEEAIDLFDQSMSLLPATHPSICNIAYNLGFTLKDGYAQFHDNDYLTSSRLAFERAAKCDFAFTYDRFIAARQWAIHEDRDDSNALEAYRCVIGLLPRLATLEFSLETRREMLNANSDGLARDAMACAVRLKDFEKAIELLEEGRAVFWSQALQLRTPMDELHSVAPVLQTKLRDISAILEQGSHRISSAPDPSLPRNMQPIEEEERQLRRLNDEWLATLEEVRGIPDFEDFLRPRRFHHLQSAASPGETIIVINGSEQSTDALIMTSDELTHIPLPNIPFTKAQTLVKLVQAGSTTGRDISHSEAFIPYAHTIVDDIPDFEDVLATSRGGKVARKSRSRSDEIFIYVLATLWDGIVKPIVRHLNLEKTDKPTRVWWCPTGPFTFLPLHAAGHYEGAMIECAPEYIMSSYTPSIGALLQSKNIPVLSHTPKFQMMAVVQPEVLPFTVLELEKIKDHVPSESLVKLGVSDIDASVETVISHLKTVSIAHFACHGRQDLRNPLESSLILDDGDLEVSRIMQLHMPNASLAFLCACQTAMGAEDLPEEAIHLGATLLFAGFRAVIATMWSIADEDGPKIADAFYDSLFQRTEITPEEEFSERLLEPDTTQTAYALHRAIARLRSKPDIAYARWTPFIHIGR
ncbi:CHAT domain-containing protein [Crucibulum laeve]|uniref:CHAT domain-containing protein n=1 Tax=Crucibulum laeve TaxID=68775 RepID=A0A5C3MPE8_9AGAR|nr:CHAT domain-containing protein [Crucibulum laeve]